MGELIGNDLFGERVIEITADARARFLPDGVRVAPASPGGEGAAPGR